MAVRVVTDSTADLPPDLVRQWDLSVLPCSIHFGEESYRDGVDITADEFFRRLTDSPRLPTTTQPTVMEFLEVYRALTQGGDEVVSIHIADKLSGTLNSALQAREALGSATRIEIIDSLSTSMALGLIVLEAARSAREGASLQEVVEVVHRAMSRTRVFFLVDTLEYLEKGGRIGKATALLGTLLQLKPVLAIVDGEVRPVERIRTRSRALERLEALVKQHAPLEALAVLYTTTLDEAEALGQRLKPHLFQGEPIVARAGATIGTHGGPGLLGAAFMTRA